jgi:hypothetical protein
LGEISERRHESLKLKQFPDASSEEADKLPYQAYCACDETPDSSKAASDNVMEEKGI